MIEPIDAAGFEILATHTGLPLSAEQKRELFEMYGYLVPMIAKVCKDRPREAEPCLIFKAGAAS